MPFKISFCALAGALLVSSLCVSAAPTKIVKKPRRLLRPASAGYGSYSPKLKWKTPFSASSDIALVAGDVDADGGLDLIVAGRNASAPDGVIARLNERGERVWSFRTSSEPTAGPALGDVDRDGLLDIVVAVDRVVLCLNARGQLKWRRELPFDASFDPEKSVGIESVPTIADLNGDGKNEVLIGTNDGTLFCLDARGKTRWKFKARSWIVGGVAVADLGGDKGLEVVFGSYDRNLYCLNAAGAPKWKREFGDWVSGSPVIGDLEGDGSSEIVAASDDGFVHCLTRTGTEKWRAQFSQSETRNKAYLAVADLDGDGTLETIAAEKEGKLHVLLSDGSQAWVAEPGAIDAAPLVADLNGDGYQEIIQADDNGFTVLQAWGIQSYRREFGAALVATPVLIDSNRDGRWEIACITGAEAEESETGAPEEAGDSEAPEPAQPEAPDMLSLLEFNTRGGVAKWATLKGDPYRTGSVANALDYGARAAKGVDYATAFEPYGLGQRPQSGQLAPRRVRVSLLPLDDARGNRDGALDPGETAWIRVKVENFGPGASYDNLLKLDLGRSFLRLDRASAYLGFLAPGATKTATFRLSAPSLEEIKRLQNPLSASEGEFVDPNEATSDAPTAVGATRGKTRRLKTRAGRRKAVLTQTRPTFGAQFLNLSVLESGVPAAVSRAVVFNVPPLPPRVKIIVTRIVDAPSKLTTGNGNGRLDANENVILRLTLQNIEQTTAQNATVQLSSGSSDVLVATPSVTLKNWVPFGARMLDFSLRVTPRPQRSKADLKLSIYATTTGGKVLPQAQSLSLALSRGSGDITPPEIVLQSPPTAIFNTRAASFRIAGVVRDASPLAAMNFERRAVALTANRFAFVRALKIGENVFPLSVTDAAGNSATRYIRIVRKP